MLSNISNPISISVTNNIGTSYYEKDTGKIFIDFSDLDKFYMGKNGNFIQFNLTFVVIHELLHALYNYNDLTDPLTKKPISSELRDYNNPEFDHIGQASGEMNKILVELGLSQDQSAGYDAIALNRDYGISYTEGNQIDIAYFDNAKSTNINNLDLSQRGDSSRDLIIGLDGDDKIYGGAGDDYLYGGKDNDTIYGGSGNDVIHGGLLGMDVSSDGEDTVDYSIGDKGEKPKHGVTVNIGKEGKKLDGLAPIIVSDDGYGNEDRLYSIEKFKLTDSDDTVLIEKNGGELLEKLIEIDGGDGKEDKIDFSKFESGISYRDGKISGNSFEISLRNFEKIIGTEFDDLFVSDDTEQTFEGGKGFDTYYVGAGDTIIDSDGKGEIFVGPLGDGGTALEGPSWFMFYGWNEEIYAGYMSDVDGNPKDKAGNAYSSKESETGYNLIIHLAKGDGTITIKNWNYGDFGIFFGEKSYLIHDGDYNPECYPDNHPDKVLVDSSLHHYTFDPDTYDYASVIGAAEGGSGAAVASSFAISEASLFLAASDVSNTFAFVTDFNSFLEDNATAAQQDAVTNDQDHAPVSLESFDQDIFVFKADFGQDSAFDLRAAISLDDMIGLQDNVFAGYEAVLEAASQIDARAIIGNEADSNSITSDSVLPKLHHDDFRYVA